MKIWEEFLTAQEKVLGAEAIERWARPLKVVHFDAGNLYLEAQDNFQLHWFEQHLRPEIKLFFRNNNQRPIKVHLTVPQSQTKKAWKPVLHLAGDSLNPACRFETFFAGSNGTSLALLKEASEKSSYNPIYLCGAEGAGKSHLLMALCFFLHSVGKKCLYVKASTLTNHIVAAIRSSSMQKLRDFYRQHDVLFVDDIDELANRSATQEEIFHTFNTLHLAGKQIVLAGRALPSKLTGIEPRLTSRFEWGLVLPIHPLSPSERKDFLKHQNLPQEIETLLLSELHSVPLLLKALSLISGRTDIKKAIAPLVEEQRKKSVTPEKIIHAAAQVFEINPSDILGRSQAQEFASPRQIAMYLCRSILKMPFLKIAEVFSRDHSTVMSSVKGVEKKLGEPDKTLLSSIELIKSKLS